MNKINHLTTDWYKLLNYWRTIKNRNGLTFPFLIGRRKISNKNCTTDSSCINDLIMEIIDSDVNIPLMIEHCPEIGEYVLAISDTSKIKNGFPLKDKFSETKIIITVGSLILGTTYDQISFSLWGKYGDKICRGEFSKNDMIWGAYTKEDEIMLKKLDL